MPELNDIEPVWRDLKAHHLAHQTLPDPDALDQGIHQAVAPRGDAERIASTAGLPPHPCLAESGLARPAAEEEELAVALL